MSKERFNKNIAIKTLKNLIKLNASQNKKQCNLVKKILLFISDNF